LSVRATLPEDSGDAAWPIHDEGPARIAADLHWLEVRSIDPG
jgi:hypothetical protein